MCGNTGWIDWEVDLTRQRRVLETMVKTLSCRGPDAGGSVAVGRPGRRSPVDDAAVREPRLYHHLSC